MRKVIQVGNLGYSMDDGDLARLFAPHGTVYNATVSIHFNTGQSTGVGFVEMESGAEGDAAIAALNGREHCGRILAVCWSKPRCDVDGTSQEMSRPIDMAEMVATSEEKQEQRGLP